MKNINTDVILTHLYGIGVVLAFVLPHTATPLLMFNPLLCITYKLFKQNQTYYKYNWIALSSIFFSLIINIYQEIELKSLLTTCTILLYIICFPFVRQLKPKNIYLYLVFSFIFISQITYILNIPGLTSFFNTYYPVLEGREQEFNYMQDNITTDNYLSFRMGGLYRNANDCARALTMILITFIIWNIQKKTIKVVPFVIVIFYAVLLTGSRTGFIIASISVFLYLTKTQKFSIWEYTFVACTMLAIGFAMFGGDESYRGLDVEEGVNDSFMKKVDTFFYFFTNEDSVFRLLFGYLDPRRFSSAAGLLQKFDSDYGNLIFCYGIVGFISILLYFLTIYKRMNITGKIYFVLLLWMLSSTIVMAFRAFFLFMLLLSSIYSNKDYSLIKGKDRVVNNSI